MDRFAETLDEFLTTLDPTVPKFANLASHAARNPDAEGGEMPAAQRPNEERDRET